MPASPHLWTLGLNHDSAPLDVRARFALPTDKLGAALLQASQAVPDLQGMMLLSTCNRTEMYAQGDAVQMQLAQAWLANLGGVTQEALAPHLYQHTELGAAKHALRVAAGLDSMVLGEPQILGQVKEAVRTAKEAGVLGGGLQQLFERAFAVAKDVRSQTEVGSHSISMAAAATRLAANVFEDWQHTRVLLVGAGEMIELCAAHFAAKTPKRMAVANRTVQRGLALAQRFGTSALVIETLSLAELPSHLHEFDVVVSSTASTLPIIGLGAVQHAIKLRKHRPMVMVDLAVPRDIEPEVKDLSDVYLYTVDDLANQVQSNKANRAAAVADAEKIIAAGLAQWTQWQQERVDAVPKIQALQEQAKAWQMQEIDRVKKQWGAVQGLTPQQWDEALQALARNLSNKFLHAAILHIKEQPAPEPSTL